MSVERMHSEQLSRCKNCKRRSLNPLITEGHSFCNAVCYSEWLWKRERMEAAARARDATDADLRSYSKEGA